MKNLVVGMILLFLGTDSLRAQTRGFISNPIFTNNPTAFFVVSNLLAEPPPEELIVPNVVSLTSRTAGTYWTLSSAAPLPFNPFPDLPFYAIGTNQFLIDDRSVDYVTYNALAASLQASGALTNPTITIDTNGLWLEAKGVTNGNFKALLHNAVEGQAYDLLTKSDLVYPIWGSELTITGAIDDATEFELPMNGRTNLFVWARIAMPYSFFISTQPFNQIVYSGDTVAFFVGVNGNTNVTYQWTFNGVPVEGATNSSYSIPTVWEKHGGDYMCIISDGTNSVVSAAATLTVRYGADFDFYTMPIVSDRQDYTFKNGVVYFIPSAIRLYGNTTIEAGAIIKIDKFYAYSGSPDAGLIVMGTLTCKGEPYHPSVITSFGDGTQGDIDIYFSFHPFMVPGAPFLDLTYAQSSSISNIRFCYADQAVTTPATSRHLDVWNCQFYKCNYGVVNLVGGVGAKNSLHNVLFADCGVAIGASTNSIDVDAEQVTADVDDFCLASSTPNRIAVTNSILWGNSLTAGSVSSVNVVFNPDPTNFETAFRLAHYYLTKESPLHHAGTANISPHLKNELRNKTTYAPIVFPPNTVLSGEMTLGPQPIRYTNGAPDLGYHYDALDYSQCGIIVNGGKITVLPGTAIGFRNDLISALVLLDAGFLIGANSSFISEGTPDAPITYSHERFVQETPDHDYISLNIYWSVLNHEWIPVMVDFIAGKGNTDPTAVSPVVDFRFCHFYSAMADYLFWSGEDEWVYAYSCPDSAVDLTLRDSTVQTANIRFGKTYDPQFTGTGHILWQNNVFENVQTSIDPDWIEYGDTNLYVDLRFEAYNNQFKGGGWLHLQPVPSSAGNWTLKDNLFDGVNFIQDDTMPLDFGHNGYCPLSGDTLDWLWLYYPVDWPVNMPTLQPTPASSGSGEVVWSNQPPYQSGPYGNYYLPTNTPFYHAGSKTAGEAGLAQYTTATNQTKDNATQPVNIGAHFIAANSSNKVLDSDSDGVPDYMEDANGNGLLDSNETDSQNPVTDSVTPDVYSTVYDDMDISGNGLAGRIKKTLGLNPLDVSNPLILKQVNTGEEPDIVTFETLVNYSILTNGGKVNLLLDGAFATLIGSDFNTNGLSLIKWNITFDSPGKHVLQPKLTINGQIKSSNSPDFTALNGFGNLMIFNADSGFQFDPFYSVFDNSHGATLYAKTPTCPNADYTIELKTLSGAHIKTISGSTSSGEIVEHWDLTDDEGNIITNDSVNAVFNVTLLDPGSYSHTLNLNRMINSSLPEAGNFTIAYAWDNMYEATHDLKDCMQLSIVDPLLKPCNVNFCFDHPYQSTFNDWTYYPYSSGNPGLLIDDSSVSNLLGNLANTNLFIAPTRNFFFFGHGSQVAIGDGSRQQVNLDYSQVRSALGNSSFWNLNRGYSPKKNFLPNWAYRFVFLDACDTGDDPDWALSFGIYRRLTSAQLILWPERAQAFVGWEGEQKVPGNGDMSQMDNAFTIFIAAWQSGYPLDECIDFASYYFPPDPFNGYYLQWNFGTSVQHWNPIQQWIYKISNPNPRLVIYGYAGLTRTGFQPEHDNSRYYKK